MHSQDEGVWVSIFIIMGKDFNPDPVVARFALDVNESWNKDKINPTSGETYNYGSVTFSVREDVKDRKLEDHLCFWIDALENHEEELRRLKQSACDIFIECWIASGKIEGVTLEHELLSRLAQLSVDLEIRFYPNQTAG